MKRNLRSSRRTILCLERFEDRCCLSAPPGAAPFGFGWADRAGSATNDDIGRAVATDGAGNVYVTGFFTASADFGPTPDGGLPIRLSASPPDTGAVDLFVAKYSSSGVVQWVKDTGSIMGVSSSAEGQGIDVDANGNVYVTGIFYGSAVFGAGEGAKETPLSAAGNSPFAAKYAPDGSLLWARQYGDPAALGGNYGLDLALDSHGGLYLTGDFTGDATMGGSTLTSSFRLFARANGNQFRDGETFTIGVGTQVAKFEYDKNNSTTAGNIPIPITDLNGQQAIVAATAQAINGANASGKTGATAGVADWYVYIRQTVSVQVDPASASLSLSRGQNAFLAKLQDADGSVVWAQDLSGPTADDEHANSVVVNDAGVYVASQASHAHVTGSGYIWKFGLDGGAPLWMDQFFPIATAITLDPIGNVLATGVFGTAARDFDPGPGTYNLKSVQNSSDIFVLKLDTNGKFVWANAMGGSKTDYGMGVATDAAGNVYTTGFFNGDSYGAKPGGGNSADFNPGSGTFSLTSQGTYDIFVQKLSPAGAFLWAGAMGGPSTDQGLGIAVDRSGNVYTTGQFAATADFNPTSGQSFLTSAGDQDIFLAKLTQPNAPLAQGSAAGKAAKADALTVQEVQPLLDQAIEIANLSGTTAGFATSNSIWPDDNAAGWDKFVDHTPANDFKLTSRGNQGEQQPLDLLVHEIAQLLSSDQLKNGVMEGTLAIGARKTPAASYLDTTLLDRVFDGEPMLAGRQPR